MKPMIAIGGVTALLAGLAFAHPPDLAIPERSPAEVRMAPAIKRGSVAANDMNDAAKLRITYHLSCIDGGSFAATLESLMNTNGIHIITESTENTTTVIATPQYQKAVIDILSALEPHQKKLDVFR